MNPESSTQKAVRRKFRCGRIPASCKLPPANCSSGFTLLIAVIFMSVMLAIGVAFASLGYKQVLLAASTAQSQHAFYAADAALECALYYDKLGEFNYISPVYVLIPPRAPSMDCDGNPSDPNETDRTYPDPSTQKIFLRHSLDNDTRCADVTVYKPADPTDGQTFIFSQGYSIGCDELDSGAPFSVRGIYAHY